MDKPLVALRPINRDNFLEAFDLRLSPEQEAFVSHPIRSLAQAYVYRALTRGHYKQTPVRSRR
jgi:hypothetical protein